MQRTNLIKARELADISQEELAAILDVRQATVSAWETGQAHPQAFHRRRIRDILKNTNTNLFDIDGDDNAPTLSREDELIEMLRDFDRREILELFAKLPVFAGVNLSALFSTTVIAPEELLSLCRAVIDEGWSLHDQGQYAIANRLLTACVTKLSDLTTHPSPYQHQAASLSVEATIIQMINVSHTLDYSRRVTLGLQAVRFGELSGDSNIHVMAIGWHGTTYTFSYRQPETAIATLNKALPLLGDDTVNKADILMSLATAYAQDRNKKMARHYAAEAQIAMPENPQLDPLYQIIRTGHTELDMRMGRMYLILAKYFPKGGYAKMAYDTFMKTTSEQALSKGNQSETLILKADSARAIGDMDESVKCLTNGLLIGVEVNSKVRLREISDVLNGIPDEWRKETPVIALQKELAHAITVTQ